MENLVDQNRFWSTKYWNWLKNGRWMTYVYHSIFIVVFIASIIQIHLVIMNTKNDTRETETGDGQGTDFVTLNCAMIVLYFTDLDHVIDTEAVDTIGTITVETETGIEIEEM